MDVGGWISVSQSNYNIARHRVIIGFLITVLIACFLFSEPVFSQDIEVNSPLGYNLIGGTSHVSGGLVDIQTDDSSYLSFASYPSTQVSDFVDSNDSDVDSLANIGVQGNFSAQKLGPDSSHDLLTEKNTDGIVFAQVTIASEQSSTNTVWTDVPGANVSFTPDSTTEEWLVIVTADILSSSTSEDQARFRYAINGVPSGETGVQQGTINLTPIVPYNTYFHFTRVTGNVSKQMVKFQFQASTGATAFVRNLQILCIRLDPASLEYSEVDGDILIEGSQTLAMLQFTPSSSGDYVIAYCGLVSELPLGGGAETWLNHDSGTSLAPIAWSTPNTRRTLTDRDQFEPHGLLSRINLTAVQHTFAVEAQLRVIGENSTARDVRIAAFRVDAFDLFEFDEDLDVSSTLGTNTVRSVVNTQDPGESREYLILAGIHTISSGISSREAGAVQIDSVFVQRKGDQRLSFPETSRIAAHYACVKKASASFKVETTYGTGGAGLDTIHSKQSVIYVLKIPTNYELDLEAQWTALSYNMSYTELCIFGGTMGSEDIFVEVWNDTGWQGLFTDLTGGWNNISVSQYVKPPVFTIRFKGSMETGDSLQDSWEIDVALIYAWADDHIVEVEFFGSSSPGELTQTTWIFDTSWTSALVNVTLELYNYILDDYSLEGDGYLNYISSSIPEEDETRSPTITINPSHYRNASGYWRTKIRGCNTLGGNFELKVDLAQFEVRSVKPPDVAVLSVTMSTRKAHVGEVVTINVTIANKGETTETFNVTIYNNNTQIGIQTVSNLAPNSNLTVGFSWDTTHVLLGIYTIRARADILTGELNLDDNNFVSGLMEIEAQTSWQPFSSNELILSALVILGILIPLTLKLRQKKKAENRASSNLEFNEQFGMTQEEVAGKKVLLEVDPALGYHNALFGFVSEAIVKQQSLFIFTGRNSALHTAFSGKNVKFFLLTSKTSSRKKINNKEVQIPASDLSILLDTFSKIPKTKKPPTILYDNLSDTILMCGYEKTYKFLRFLLEALSSPKVTALFVFNPTAHNPATSSSIRGLFRFQLADLRYKSPFTRAHQL